MRTRNSHTGIRLGAVVVIVACIAIVVSFIAFAASSRVETSSPIKASDLSGGVAARVNEVSIGENAATEYVQSYRQAQGLEADDDWGSWLVEQGATPEMARSDAVESLIGLEVLRQAAASRGSSIASSEVEDEFYKVRSAYRNDADWNNYLISLNCSDAMYRLIIESTMLSERISRSLGEENPSADEQALDEIVYDWTADYKLSCDIEIEDMPDGLPYDVGLGEYRGTDADSPASNLNRHIFQRDLTGRTGFSEVVSQDDVPSRYAELCEGNSDVTAWLYMPNTNISFPVMRHPSEDDYYQWRDTNGEKSKLGSLYMEKANSGDFDDSLTVVYGHSFTGQDRMFTQLHLLEDEDFFQQNDSFFIYREGTWAAYRIVSAFIYDDRHLVNSFSTSDPEKLQPFFDYLEDPDASQKEVRGGFELDAVHDHVVVLSTCTVPSVEGARFLVAGVEEEGL